MTTNVRPRMNGSNFDDDGPVGFPTRRTSVTDHSDVTRLLESKRSAKQIMKAAEGHKVKSKPRVQKESAGENLAKKAKKKKKKGSFGESYDPVKAPNKGVRVSESIKLELTSSGSESDSGSGESESDSDDGLGDF